MGLTPGQGVWLDGVVTIPDELVQVAAEVMCQLESHGYRPMGIACSSCTLRAKEALQAAFAKLPECEAAVQALADALLNTNDESVRFALSALAREFGGQE